MIFILIGFYYYYFVSIIALNAHIITIILIISKNHLIITKLNSYHLKNFEDFY